MCTNIALPCKYGAILHSSYASLQSKLLQICYADDRYVCFARDEDKWLIYDFETVQVCVL